MMSYGAISTPIQAPVKQPRPFASLGTAWAPHRPGATAQSPSRESSPLRNSGPAHVLPARKISARYAAAPYVAEFAGTFLLVFTYGCCGIVGDVRWNSTGIGFMVLVLSYALGPVSGGQFNPAITLTLWLSDKLRPGQFLSIVICQLGAAVLAGTATTSLFGRSASLGPAAPYSGLEAGGFETLYTCVLCFVYLRVCASSRTNPQDDGNQFFGLALGFAVIAGGYATGSVAGASLNPAVSLGLALPSVTKDYYWGAHYVLDELVGALLAVALNHLSYREELLPNGSCREVAPRLLVRLLAEFFGSFVVALTAGVCIVCKREAMSWAYAAATTALTYALGNISGAHFSPAVTLAVVFVGRRMRWFEGLLYALAQLLGGLLAGHYFYRVHQAGPYAKETFALSPVGQYTWPSALLCELVFSSLVVFVFLSVMLTSQPGAKSRHNFYYGIAVGCAVAAGSFGARQVSGGAVSPTLAVALAYAFGSTTPNLACITYAVFQVAGALLASVAFVLVRPEEFQTSWRFSWRFVNM